VIWLTCAILSMTEDALGHERHLLNGACQHESPLNQGGVHSMLWGPSSGRWSSRTSLIMGRSTSMTVLAILKNSFRSSTWSLRPRGGGDDWAKANYLPTTLSSVARSWLMNLPKATIYSWDQLCAMFMGNFQGTYKHPSTTETLKTIKQKHDESLWVIRTSLHRIQPLLLLSCRDQL
jgi:hypothetical protein